MSKPSLPRRLLGRLLGGGHHAEVPARPEDAAVARGHEFRDVPVGNVLIAAFALFATLLVTLLVVWGLFTLLQSNRRAATVPRDPLAATPVTPPEPRLQPDPASAYQADRTMQEEQLSRYQWADGSQQAVRIPIDRAMDLLAERGLPTTVPLTPTVVPAATETGAAATETATP